MKDQLKTLNTYFWNVGNDIADIRLLAEGALALYESDAEPLHRLGMKNNEEVASSAFDTIGTALYDLRERIANMQEGHLQETIRQSIEREA
ncbi:MAG: hypothetical protein U0L09_10110 [Christensenellales bacterium]|nr:hypothetical protein [Christensenellales bacterium]